MKKLHNKMTTEELAEYLCVARQTVNRWIREQGWKTEKFPGVKGGRARLIHIDEQVRDFILTTPAMRQHKPVYQAAEPIAEYRTEMYNPELRQISEMLKNMTSSEQEKLAALLAREGIRGFLTRLGISESDNE